MFQLPNFEFKCSNLNKKKFGQIIKVYNTIKIRIKQLSNNVNQLLSVELDSDCKIYLMNVPIFQNASLLRIGIGYPIILIN